MSPQLFFNCIGIMTLALESTLHSYTPIYSDIIFFHFFIRLNKISHKLPLFTTFTHQFLLTPYQQLINILLLFC